MNYIFLFLIRFSHSAWLDLIILTSSARLVLAYARTSATTRTALQNQTYRPDFTELDTPHFRPHASSSLTLGHRRPHAPPCKIRPIGLILQSWTRRISDRTPRPRYRSGIGSKSPCPFEVFLACVPPSQADGGLRPPIPPSSRPAPRTSCVPP